MTLDDPTDGPVDHARASSRTIWLAFLGGVSVFGILGLVFGLLVSPAEYKGCTDTPMPGLYADLLIPLHLLAQVALSALIAWLAAARAPERRPGRRTVVVLAAAGAFTAVSFVWSAPLAAWGMVALLAGGSVVLPAICLVSVIRATLIRVRVAPEARAGAYARLVQMLLWVALIIALPATFAGAWVNAVGLFCF